MPTTSPTPGPEPVRRGEPIRATQFNEVVARLKSLGGLVARDVGIGSSGHGGGAPSVHLAGEDEGWGSFAARGYWGRITESPGATPMRGGSVKYSAAIIGKPRAILADVEPYYGRDWPPGTPPEQTPLIIPAQEGDLCIIVREAGAEPGERVTRLWVLTERIVRRVCPASESQASG